MLAMNIRTLADLGSLLLQRWESLLNAVLAREHLCCIAVRVGLCQDTWESKCLTDWLGLTVVPSAKINVSVVGFGCSNSSVLSKLRSSP